MAGDNRPTHRAYSVRERDDADPFWNRIGSVFAHGDGKGFNVVLDALPLDGRIVIREIDDKDEAEPRKGQATRSNKKRAA